MQFNELVGKTIIDFEGTDGDSEIRILLDDMRAFKLYHSQDCCESVYVESIVGDPADLLFTPVTLAEESTSELPPAGRENGSESNTWTFYKLATRKGYVDIRWHGQSNGYYSESVDFVEVK